MPNYASRHENEWERGDTAPVMFNLVARFAQVSTLTLHRFSPVTDWIGS